MLLVQNLSAEQDEPLTVNDTLQGPGTVKLLVSGEFRENQSGEAIVIGTTIRRNRTGKSWSIASLLILLKLLFTWMAWIRLNLRMFP